MTFPPADASTARNRLHPLTGKISVGVFAVNILIVLIITAVNFVLASVGQTAGYFGGLAFGYAAIIAPILSLVGLIFGIVGIFKKNHARIYPIFGVILNGLWFLCATGMWILFGLALYALANTPWR